MCGIFGIILRPGANASAGAIAGLLRQLYVLSESRGKESAGLHLYAPASGDAWTIKGAQSASQLLKTPALNTVLGQLLPTYFDAADNKSTAGVALIAHSRLVTNGTAQLPQNNQPVRWGAVTMVHNGIVVNVDALWKGRPDLVRNAEVDTEVMAAMAADSMANTPDPILATRGIFGEVLGAASIVWMHDQTSIVTLATNTGDLYFLDLPQLGLFAFASELYILRQALTSAGADWKIDFAGIEWLPPRRGILVDISGQQELRRFGMEDAVPSPVLLLERQPTHHDERTGAAPAPMPVRQRADESLIRYSENTLREIRRCTRCVLPETFPFIAFDSEGVCSYCRSYRPRYEHMHPTESRAAFVASLERYRRSGGGPDVLVAFSGGRDSSYGLHLIKKEFGLNPITFTYDWGMVTDLARRNIARICGQLGIQNILVSADLAMKRDNIRKNVSAWLKRPDLGLVPLFMAGDKHFFRVANQLKRQTGIDLDLWCANPLENTDFKAGLCGVSPDFSKSRVDYLSFGRKVQLLAYYGRQFLRNPAYLNSSLQDTVGAFLAYYVEPRRDFYFIFDHFIWNENEVNRVLLTEYDWELATDSPSTWRIGDGTAPFYNYIYMTARGFTEFDTFRSNQIREGMITRQEALEAILVENRPRIESLRWYLETIELDFNAVVKAINRLDTLGLHG